MTKEQLQNLLHSLHLEYDSAPTFIHVFYQDEQGLINNFSISVQHARQKDYRPMGAGQLAELMEREYPATRGARILAVEHPHKGLQRWLDTLEVCHMLHVTARALSRWSQAGFLHPSRLGRRNYYRAEEIEAFLQSNILQDNGRLDRKGS